MSDYSTNATVNLHINGQEAVKKLEQLKTRAFDLQNAIAKAAAAGNKTELTKLRKELKSTNAQIRQIESATQEVENVLRRLDKATPKELQRSLRTLEKQLQSIERGSAAWTAQTEKIRLVKAEMARLNAETRLSESLGTRLMNTWQKWQPVAVAAAAAISGLLLLINKYRQALNEYEESEHSLKALTGLAQQDLDWLKQQAEELSTTLEKHGMRVRQSASEILQAYMLVGSNKPELLADNEALNEVTIEAMRLAAAGGIDLKTAVNALTTAMNQFSAEASLAAKYVNIFAAGSKYGAADISAQADAILKVGVAAKTAGLSIEQLDGAIEMMGEMGVKGSVAGTYLNAFLLKLATGARAGQLQTEGLASVLRSLNDEFVRNEAVEAGKGMALFKKEFSDRGIRAALILSQNIEKFEYYTKAVTDTSIAEEQAAVNSDTMAAKIAQMRNELQLLGMEMAQKLAPMFALFLGKTRKLTLGLKEVVDFLSEYGTYVLEVGTAMIVYSARVKILTATHKAYDAVTRLVTGSTGAISAAMVLARDAAAGDAAAIGTLKTTMAGTNIVTRLFTAGTLLLKSAFHLLSLDLVAAKAEMKAFGAVLASNPAELLVTAVTAATVALTRLVKKEREHRKELEEERKVQAGITKEYLEGAARIKALTTMIEDDNVALGERRKALEELNRIVPDYNGQLNEEGSLIMNNTRALDEYLKRLKQEITMKANRDKLEALFKEQTEVEEHHTSVEKEYWEVRQTNTLQGRNRNSLVGVLTEGWDRLFNVGEYGLKEQLEKDEKRLSQLKTDIEKITGNLEVGFDGTESAPGGNDEEEPTPEPTVPEVVGAKDKFAAEKEWKEKEEALNRIAYATGEADYEQYTKRMEAIAIEFYARQLAHTDLTQTEELTAKANLYEALRKQREAAEKRTVEDENRHHEEILDALRESCINGESTYEQYEKDVKLEEMRHLRDIVSLYGEGSEERLAAQRRYNEALLKDQQEHQKEMEAAEKKHQEDLAHIKEESFGLNAAEKQSRFASELALLQEVYDAEIAAAKDNAEERLRIETAFNKARIALRRKYGIEGRDESQNVLQGLADDIDEWLKSDFGRAVTGAVDAVSSSMSAIFSQVSSLMQAETDLTTASLEKRYDAEIDAAEGNAYRVKQLEEKKQEDIARVKDEASRKMFAMEVMQAIAQTATSALNAYSSAAAVPVVGYILAPIAAAGAVAAGSIQVAAIKKQQQASLAQGYSAGGFTRKGRKDEPAGVVHAGEWVASQKLLASPVARPMIEALDYAQRTNTIGSLKAEDVSRSIMAPTVLASAASEDGTAAALLAQAASLHEYARTMERLKGRLDEPFVTVNTVTGDKGINHAQLQYERMMKNKSPKHSR